MSTSPDDFDQPWWERTFRERQQSIEDAFGPSHPPGSPPNHVVALDLSWPTESPDLVIPGACAQVFPPNPPAERATAPQTDWLYLTSGLSQPMARGEPWGRVGTVRADLGDRLSAYGAEFGLLLPEPAEWATAFLRWLVLYVSTQAVVSYGHRFPFGFCEQGGRRNFFVGPAEELGVVPVDATAGIVFLPLQSGPASIVTSTGWFGLLIGTTVTADELAFARQTSTAHLILLLMHAGVGQRSLFGRPSVLTDPRWSAEASRIGRLDPSDVDQALGATSARAHAAAGSVSGGIGSAR